uniref:Uncharacterized protein n=1 Tax=Oscillatoriales cyanobacterium SpSt-418 TaxID=2282169 RepID=A0A7C3KF33_9CYAN
MKGLRRAIEGVGVIQNDLVNPLIGQCLVSMAESETFKHQCLLLQAERQIIWVPHVLFRIGVAA